MPDQPDTLDTDQKDFFISDFRSGVNSYFPADRIQNNAMTSAQNAIMNENGVLTRRPGITQVGSLAISTARLPTRPIDMIVAGHGIQKKIYISWSDVNDIGIFDSFDGGLTDTTAYYGELSSVLFEFLDGSMCWGRNASNSEFVYVSGAQFAFSAPIVKLSITDTGTAPSLSTVSSGPTSTRFITNALGRLWATGGIAASRDYLWYSKYNDGDTWDTTLGVLRIITEEGEGITGIHPFRQNFMFIGMEQSCYLLGVGSGASILDWDVQTVSTRIGCGSHQSIATVGQDVFFMDQFGEIRSLNMIAQSDGAIVNDTQISLPIKDQTDLIDQANTFRACSAFHKGHYWISFKTTSGWVLYTFNILNKNWTGPHVLKDSSGNQLNVRAMATSIGELGTQPLSGRDDHLYFLTDIGDGTAGSIQVFELDESVTKDDGATAIDFDITTKALHFDQPHRDKELGWGEIYFRSVSGTTGSFTVWCRSDFKDWQRVDVVDYTKSTELDKKRFSLRGIGRGRWFQFRITSSDLNTDLEVLSLIVRLKGYTSKNAG